MRFGLLRVGVVLALAVTMPTPAHAQFGKLGDAIKKKAKEVGADAITKKDEPAKRPDTPPAAQVTVNTVVLDRLTTALNMETGNRGASEKRQHCAEAAVQSPGYDLRHVLPRNHENSSQWD